MSALTDRERIAVESVARRFSARWEEGSGSAGAFLWSGGKRVAVDVASLERSGFGRANAAVPRLRFDRVVIRLMERLRAALPGLVPDGTTVLLTVTAPVRLPSKTAAALEDEIRALSGHGSSRTGKYTIHRNRVRIGLLRDGRGRALVGFVHDPGSDPIPLLAMAREFVERFGRDAGRAKRLRGARWLILIGAAGASALPAYRSIRAQLGEPARYKRILMVSGGRRVGVLAP